ncbi:MAG: DUF5040 domain-containing protein [Alistipes shahii]|nr:DUF5040 domain-containing protein [Alistipes shahii]
MKKLLTLLLALPLLWGHAAAQENAKYTILLTGASFASPQNGWFEIGCRQLEARALNRAVGGESIADTANRMAEGTLWNAGELDALDALVIMQVHNRDVSATGGLKEKYTDYTAAEIDELWAEREESELTKRLLAENDLPNLAKVFTQRRYVRKDNLAISESYFALLKEKGFFNN